MKDTDKAIMREFIQGIAKVRIPTFVKEFFRVYSDMNEYLNNLCTQQENCN